MWYWPFFEQGVGVETSWGSFQLEGYAFLLYVGCAETTGDSSFSEMMDVGYMENPSMSDGFRALCLDKWKTAWLRKVARWCTDLSTTYEGYVVYAYLFFFHLFQVFYHFSIHFMGVYHYSLSTKWKDFPDNSLEVKFTFQSAIQTRQTNHVSRSGQHILDEFSYYVRHHWS